MAPEIKPVGSSPVNVLPASRESLTAQRRQLPLPRQFYPHIASMNGRSVRRVEGGALTPKARAFMTAILALILLLAIASNPVSTFGFIAIGITALLLCAIWKGPITDLLSRYFQQNKEENPHFSRRDQMREKDGVFEPETDYEL